MAFEKIDDSSEEKEQSYVVRLLLEYHANGEKAIKNNLIGSDKNSHSITLKLNKKEPITKQHLIEMLERLIDEINMPVIY